MISFGLRLSPTGKIDFDNNYEIYSSFQSLISKYDNDLAMKIHENRGVPIFNLSSLIPIRFDGKPNWRNTSMFLIVINSIHDDLASSIVKMVKQEGKLTLNDGTLSLLSVDVKHLDYRFVPTIPELKSRGPIVIKDKEGYHVVGTPDYEKYLMGAMKRKADAVTGRETIVRGVSIVRGRRKLYRVHGHSVPASILDFILDADEDVIRTALIYGVGAKTQMGFGMVALND